MCRTRSPAFTRLADPTRDAWRRRQREMAEDLRALAAQARVAGLGGPLTDEAEAAAEAHPGVCERDWLRLLQRQEDAACALAAHLRRAGQDSAEIADWAPGYNEPEEN
jgi:hypothetical protein